MGGGDLNLKKSWHPMLMSNQKKVWEEETKALEERKRIDQMMKERAEERQKQEYQELQEAAGGRKRQQRVDWMYSGPSSGQQGTTEEMEGYLLGKRRIDGLLKGTENQKLEKGAKEESFMAVQNANNLRDTAAKIREDPMLAIKKQEQAAYEAMMNDPVRRRLLLKAAGQEEPRSSEREHKRRKHRHHNDEDSGRRHHKHRSSRHNDNGRNNYRSREYSSQRDKDDSRKARSSRYERRSRSLSNSRSRSPKRRDGESQSPRKRSRSKESHRRGGARDTSESPHRSRDSQREIKRAKSWHNGVSNRPQRSPSRERKATSNGREEDVAARLAAMQENATDLDHQRERRLLNIAEQETKDAQREEAERTRNAKYGGRAGFVDRFNRKAGDLSLGDRLGRSGQSRRHSED